MWLGSGLVVVVAVPGRPLAWELPYATSAALKRQKTNKQTKKKPNQNPNKKLALERMRGSSHEEKLIWKG